MLYQNDHYTMLALQDIVQKTAPCVYLEVGSLLGGSMVPYLLDPRCIEVHSVDLRPPLTPDERGITYDYDHATTAQMIENLKREVPDSNMQKLRTYDMDSAAFAKKFLPSATLSYEQNYTVRPNLVFLDAEHTNRAVFQDFLNLNELLQEDAIFAFHDSNLIFDALTNIQAMLKYHLVAFHAAYLPDVVFALAFGKLIEPLKALAAWNEGGFIEHARITLNNEIMANMAKKGK
jgi:cephalosporin hydroxylase